MSKSSTSIRRIQESEWQIYKRLRLEALKLAPEAFGTTLEQALLRSDIEWQQQVKKFATDTKTINLLAFINEKPVGMVSCYIQDHAEMVQMWIDPSARGQSLGKALVAELKSWAKHANQNTLLASVFKTNIAAIKLYEHLGFSKANESEIEFHLTCKL